MTLILSYYIIKNLVGNYNLLENYKLSNTKNTNETLRKLFVHFILLMMKKLLYLYFIHSH